MGQTNPGDFGESKDLIPSWNAEFRVPAGAPGQPIMWMPDNNCIKRWFMFRGWQRIEDGEKLEVRLSALVRGGVKLISVAVQEHVYYVDYTYWRYSLHVDPTEIVYEESVRERWEEIRLEDGTFIGDSEAFPDCPDEVNSTLEIPLTPLRGRSFRIGAWLTDCCDDVHFIASPQFSEDED